MKTAMLLAGRRMRSLRLLTVAVLLAPVAVPSLALAQLATPGSAVVLGHLHFIVRDVAASQAFWISVGGELMSDGNTHAEMVLFPGSLILLRQGEPAGGTAGSVIDHVSFKVKNMADSAARWKAAGLKPEPGSRPRQMWMTTPDGARLEFLEDPAIPVAVRVDHVHWNVPRAAVPAMQRWYSEYFGAVPGKSGAFEGADLPGVNFTFEGVDTMPAPTRGRTLDHVGFEVRGLAGLAVRLQDAGVKLDTPYAVARTGVGVARLTDPWGTFIELTEGIDQKLTPVHP